MDDKRFVHLKSDAKFRKVPKSESKVKIDGRFQSMFTDKKFQVNYTTDKRGRPVKLQSKEDLKRFYELSSDDGSESSGNESESEPTQLKPVKQAKAPRSSTGNDSKGPDLDNKLGSKDKKDKQLPVDVKNKLRDLHVDYARGEKSLYSESSSDDEETDQEVSESEDIDHKWGELDADAGNTEEATYRLAACNLDWDRIRAIDLMVLFNSFLPASGAIKSVTIYPSEYGKQRLKEEEVKGPIELVEADPKPECEDENEEGSKYHMEKLRQYQLNRLKYYYAVITFDDANSANKIYTECDGMEYESSATKIDLRFIPDDMTFDDEPKDMCDKLPMKYEPRFFTTTALQQAKVELTWDETDPDRLELTQKIKDGKLEDISEQQLQNYLADTSDEDESSEQSEAEDSQAGNEIDKYKALLEDIQDNEEQKKNKEFEMEISWGIGLKEKTDKLIKEKQNNTEDKTPFEKYLDKKKEKRKERKQLKKKVKADNSEDSDMPSDIDMNDPYFAEEFDNPEFKTKKNRKNKKQHANEDTEEDKQKKAELNLILMNGDDVDEKKHFNLNSMLEKGEGKSKKKKKNKKQIGEESLDKDDFKIDVEDKRFSALFTSHHYNVDPTDSHYKKTKGMETLIQEKMKRRKEMTTDNNEAKKAKSEPIAGKHKNLELNMLIKNVKRKTQAYKSK